jgi:hypothetical protein
MREKDLTRLEWEDFNWLAPDGQAKHAQIMLMKLIKDAIQRDTFHVLDTAPSGTSDPYLDIKYLIPPIDPFRETQDEIKATIPKEIVTKIPKIATITEIETILEDDLGDINITYPGITKIDDIKTLHKDERDKIAGEILDKHQAAFEAEKARRASLTSEQAAEEFLGKPELDVVQHAGSGEQNEPLDKGRKRGRPGRPHFKEDIWAYKQFWMEKRPDKKEIYKEWIYRVENNINRDQLHYPDRQFNRIMEKDWLKGQK